MLTPNRVGGLTERMLYIWRDHSAPRTLYEVSIVRFSEPILSSQISPINIPLTPLKGETEMDYHLK